MYRINHNQVCRTISSCAKSFSFPRLVTCINVFDVCRCMFIYRYVYSSKIVIYSMWIFVVYRKCILLKFYLIPYFLHPTLCFWDIFNVNLLEHRHSLCQPFYLSTLLCVPLLAVTPSNSKHNVLFPCEPVRKCLKIPALLFRKTIHVYTFTSSLWDVPTSEFLLALVGQPTDIMSDVFKMVFHGYLNSMSLICSELHHNFILAIHFVFLICKLRIHIFRLYFCYTFLLTFFVVWFSGMPHTF